MTSAAQFCVRIFADRERLFAALAQTLAEEIRTAKVGTDEAGTCVALAGGETPQEVYRALQERALPWEETNFYPTDERCVAEDAPRRNDGMLRRCLGDAARVFPLREGAPPPPLHVALLGMGEDGHVASLFEDSEMEGETVFRVSPAGALEPRLTMPLSSFAAAGKVFLLFCGEKKWTTLTRPSLPVSALLAARETTEVFYAP